MIDVLRIAHLRIAPQEGNSEVGNCEVHRDNNLGTFDDFGVKNDKKVSHNMILMSKYKGQHGGKKGKKIGQCPFLLFGQCPKEIDSFL